MSRTCARAPGRCGSRPRAASPRPTAASTGKTWAAVQSSVRSRGASQTPARDHRWPTRCALQRELERERQARGELLYLRLVHLGRALLRLRYRGEHEVLQHLYIPLGDRLGIDLDGADLTAPVGRGRHDATTRRTGHRLLG